MLLELQLLLKGLDELLPPADGERQDVLVAPVEAAIGEEEGVPRETTDGNKKAGSASRRVRIRVPQASQGTSTWVSIPPSTRSISFRRAERSPIVISLSAFFEGGWPSISTMRIIIAAVRFGSFNAARRFSLWPSR